jgi:hypothetical protein
MRAEKKAQSTLNGNNKSKKARSHSREQDIAAAKS